MAEEPEVTDEEDVDEEEIEDTSDDEIEEEDVDENAPRARAKTGAWDWLLWAAGAAVGFWFIFKKSAPKAPPISRREEARRAGTTEGAEENSDPLADIPTVDDVLPPEGDPLRPQPDSSPPPPPDNPFRALGVGSESRNGVPEGFRGSYDDLVNVEGDEEPSEEE